MSGDNPCNICPISDRCLDTDCVLRRWHNISCSNNKCMLNNTDCGCLINIEDKCGACPENEIEFDD